MDSSEIDIKGSNLPDFDQFNPTPAVKKDTNIQPIKTILDDSVHIE